jgi:hypothetical protein
MQMSMIEPKGPGPKTGTKAAVAALNGKHKHNGGMFLVNKEFLDAVSDVEEGIEFWETMARKRNPQHGLSREFLNRLG